MKKILIYFCIIPALLLSSCNNWLEVKPRNETADDELFKTYSGFSTALNGTYIYLKGREAYGERLTMSDIECFARLWRVVGTTSTYYEMSNLNYENSAVEEEIKTIYQRLYLVIASANKILASAEKNGAVIKDPRVRAMIEGEAHAIRAFCHFDVLRLFGQLPANAKIEVRLPYAEKVSTSELPPYYSYEDFKQKVADDLNKAIELLDGNDPIFSYTFKQLNTSSDMFLGYRQHRFNYWAVKALQARFHLYVGDTAEAYALAKEVIAAKGVDGKALVTLGGIDMDAANPILTLDVENNYFSSPSECLMMLNAYSVMNATYVPALLGVTAERVNDTHLVITTAQKAALFSGNTVGNRYNKVWKEYPTLGSSAFQNVLMKYYYNPAASITSNTLMTKFQAIPLLKLSEMYLIVMETTGDLAEGNRLYEEYKMSHSVTTGLIPFTSLGDLRDWVLTEYRREFFGEGQMFYTYKRHASTSMLWRTGVVTERNYIVPLPVTEFDPNL